MASRRTRSHGTIGSSRPRRATTRRSAASGSRRGRRKGSSEGGRRVPETDWKSYLNDEPVEPRDITLRGAPPGGWPLRGFPGGVEFERAPRAAFVGAGHGGLAMAGHLAAMGFPVNLWNRTATRVEHIKLRGAIELEGVITGEGRVELATADIKEAVEGVDVIMVAIPAMGHREVAIALTDVVRDGQTIVLNPGRTGGALAGRAA